MTLRSLVLLALPATGAALLALGLAPAIPLAATAAAGLLLATSALALLATGSTGQVLGVTSLILLLRLGGAVGLALLLPREAILAYALGLVLGVLLDGVVQARRLPIATRTPA
jgi:hypothetical protein